jgi:hypothetical protein
MNARSFAALVVAIAFPAHAGLVSEEDASPSQALQRATLVVTVKLAAKAMESAKIPTELPKGYAPRGNLRQATSKPCGPYQFGAYVGTVEKVHVPAEHAPVSAGQRIVIFPANTGMLLDLTRRSCESGGSKSPIFERMKGGAKPTDSATLVALLRWEETVGWVEAMGGSWLDKPPLPPIRKYATSSSWTKGDDALCMTDDDCTLAAAPKFNAEGDLQCGACAACAKPGDVTMAKATAQRLEALCAQQRSSEEDAGRCAPCPATERKSRCKAMRCER